MVAASDSLLLRLKRCWFDAIAAGYKVDEYRKATEYWRKRIEDRQYSSIVFKNGYGQERPSMRVNYDGWSKQTVEGEEYYVLHLGPILELQNYSLPERLPPPAQCEVIRIDPSRLTYHPGLQLWVPLHRLPLEAALRRPVSPLAVAAAAETERDYSSVAIDVREEPGGSVVGAVVAQRSVKQEAVPLPVELSSGRNSEVVITVLRSSESDEGDMAEEDQSVAVHLACEDTLMVDLHREW